MIQCTNRFSRYFFTLLGLFGSFMFFPDPLNAQQPVNWQLSFQPSATSIMDSITWLNNFTLVIITIITLFVLGLLAFVVVKFNSRANPTPSKVSHNTLIEVVWTVVPIVILLVIVAPSIRLLYEQLDVPEADVVVKVTGYQWNWGYEYPDLAIDEYISSMLQTDDERVALAALRGEEVENFPRLLAVDNELVVPVGKVVRLDVTSADVLHAVAIPSFGIKVDAVPGRLNTTWFKADKEGLFYGQCSQICGASDGLFGHSFMPLAVRVVDQETFDQWAASARDDIDNSWQALSSEKVSRADHAIEFAGNETGNE